MSRAPWGTEETMRKAASYIRGLLLLLPSLLVARFWLGWAKEGAAVGLPLAEAPLPEAIDCCSSSCCDADAGGGCSQGTRSVHSS